MKRALTILAIALSSIIALAVLAVFVLTDTAWGHEKLRVRVVAMLNDVAHGTVKVGRIDGNLLTTVILHDVSIADSAGQPLVTVERLQTGYGLRALFSNRIELEDVELVKPVILLDRPPGGVWNYERIFPSDSSAVQQDTAGVQFGEWMMLHNVRIVEGQLTLRVPWNTDTSFSEKQRDSAIRFALSDESRSAVERTEDGFQAVQQFRNITGRMPLLRIAHPDFASRRIEVDSMRLIAAAFRPPEADIRQLSGAFEIDSDSLWFRETKLHLPSSRASLDGRYSLESGDMAMKVLAAPISLADVRFLYPPLPVNGTATFDLELSWQGSKQRYQVADLELATEGARVTGDVGITLGDTLELHETQVVFTGLSTRLIEKLAPAVDVPREGVLAGRAAVDGTMNAMRIDGDVTFDERISGRSRVIAAGELGSANGVFRARGLDVKLSPVQVDLARIAVDSLPIRGTIVGRARLDGATSSMLHARGIDLVHLDRGEQSRFTGRASTLR